MPVINRSLQYRIAGLTATQAGQDRFTKILLTGILAGSLTVSLAMRSFAAAVPTAPLAQQSHQTLTSPHIQPMPPMPDQAYDARIHEGSVELDADVSHVGIDPFITG